MSQYLPGGDAFLLPCKFCKSCRVGHRGSCTVGWQTSWAPAGGPLHAPHVPGPAALSAVEWSRQSLTTKCRIRVQDYRDALQSEDYARAARLRDQAAVGLPGWWVTDNKGDPEGHLLHITTTFGRYVGFAFTPLELAEAHVGPQTCFSSNPSLMCGLACIPRLYTRRLLAL